jgi:phosphotriesterase-related protein
LGVTLPHEHIAVASQEITTAQRDSLRCLWGMLGPQLKRNGVRTLVELTPADSGRDIALIKEVSQSTGLNILCATGYYLSAARPANFLTGGAGPAETYMTRELVDGIGDSGVKAALMKIAVGGSPGNPSDSILLEAAGRTQKQTGAPISCHATSPEHRRHLVETLEKYGADMSRVAVGHADTNATLEESTEVLKRAGYIIYTIWGITNPRLIGFRGEVAADHSARLVRGLLDKGLVKQIMFSIDFAPTSCGGKA